MEYLTGRTLEQVVQEDGPLPPDRACRYLAQVARGLAHVHQRLLVHRDIKPSNLMLTDGDLVKVLDLGLASGPALKLQFGQITTAGRVLGSLDYIAPEQQRGTGPIDFRADLYSLGATLFFLLAGRAPFEHHDSLPTRLLANMEEKPPPLTLPGPDGPALQRLINQLLEKIPEQRPPSTVRVAEALERLTVPTPAVRVSRAWRYTRFVNAWRPCLPLFVSGVIAGLLCKSERFTRPAAGILVLSMTLMCILFLLLPARRWPYTIATLLGFALALFSSH